MSVTKWVFIDETNGAKCGDGSSLDPASLRRIAIACDAQLNSEFADEYGGQYQVRDAADATDIQPGEQVYAFVPTVPNAPGASAYHDTDGKGVPVAYCAVTTCGSLFGANGVSVDATHECLEAGADPSCNLMADNLNGLLVAYEVGDPVEIQTYASHVDSEVQISNFVLKSWFDPKASAPYDFMSAARIAGAVAPPGPLQIAPGNGGNYIITETSSENSTDTFGITSGSPRKERKDTGGRFVRRLMQRQVSRRGKLKIAAGQPAPIVGEAVLTPKDITALASPVPPKVLTAAQERAKIAEAQYSIGLVSYNDWIIIENNLVSAKTSFVNAQLAALVAEANWVQAKGGTLDYD